MIYCRTVQFSSSNSGLEDQLKIPVTVSDGGTPNDPGANRHRILRQLRQQLEQHPGVDTAWGTPEGEYAAIEANVDPSYFGRDAERATLQVVWQPNPDIGQSGQRPSPDDPSTPGPRTHFSAVFRVHYSEPAGLDCGFHNEPNPHVDGWSHFQHRDSPDNEYDYTVETLGARSPVSALWEILDKLESKLRDQ